jgi:hypothetical protein
MAGFACGCGGDAPIEPAVVAYPPNLTPDVDTGLGTEGRGFAPASRCGASLSVIPARRACGARTDDKLGANCLEPPKTEIPGTIKVSGCGVPAFPTENRSCVGRCLADEAAFRTPLARVGRGQEEY